MKVGTAFARKGNDLKDVLVELRNITKSYGDNLVLDDLCLTVGENEFVTLLGPSGCGKSTTIRIVGGFEKPDSGRVFFRNQDITDIPPNKRNLNTVFQKYALFPHLTVGQNVAYGLVISGKTDKYIRDKVKYGLKLVNLSGFEDRNISSLSGGQQQRVAMARAIVNEPELLLLDEPLGALDLKLREEMEYELRRLKEELGISFLYVTHDQKEALTMSDKVIVLNAGYIQQMGTPQEIYNEPENAFVASFIGDSNIVPGRMIRDRMVEIFGVLFPCVDVGFGENRPVDVVIRPEDLIIGAPGEGKLDGTVTSNIFIGIHYEMEVSAGGFEWLIQNTVGHPVGEHVSLDVVPENIQIMKRPESEDEEALALDV